MGAPAASLWAPCDSDMEEFDSKDISTSKDEACVQLGGECHEDDINELVKGDEVDGEEETQKTKGTKRKAESILARKRKQGRLSLDQEEEEEEANRESGRNISEKEDAASEQEKGIESEGARKKEDEVLASSGSDVEPKSEAPPSTQTKTGEETEETSSSNLVKAEDLEKPKKQKLNSPNHLLLVKKSGFLHNMEGCVARHQKISPAGQKVFNMLLVKSRGPILIPPVRMKRLGQSGKDTQLLMCLVIKVNSDAVKKNIA